MDLLNIGCGSTFHPAWINLDLHSTSPHVRAHDVRKQLPFPDTSIDAVYTAHMLEHLDRQAAESAVREMWRVLRPGGVVRIVVPDLAGIASAYLAALERAETGRADEEADYDWMVLEYYDQAVRSFGGGYMGQFLNDPAIRNRAFVRSRMGIWVDEVWQTPRPTSLFARIRSKNLNWWLDFARTTLAKSIVWLLLGPNAPTALGEGLFRQSGQIHRWMYDRFSLGRLMRTAGFRDICVCSATESRIPNFDIYELDVLDGQVRKPDSLYMEGAKP